MGLIRFVVWILLFRNTSGEDFVISDFETDWTSASTNCTLATPDVVPSSGKTAIAIDGITEDVWVGYYQTRTALEYFGCSAKGNSQPSFTTKADPGQCMSVCGANKLIGISGNECFCFTYDDIKLKQTTSLHCNKECENRTGIVCGGRTKDNEGTNYISLYRSIGTDIALGGGDKKKNCLYYDKNGFTWDDCAPKYLTVCEKDNTAWIESPLAYSNWITSTIRCFAADARPSTYKNTKSLNISQNSSQSWTGVVRSHVIYKLTMDLRHLNSKSTFGYLHTNAKSNSVLKFEEANATKKCLCFNGRIGTVDNTGGSSEVGAAVGATLSILVVIAVVIGVVLFLRKRGIQIPFLKKEKQTPNQRTGQHNIGYSITQPERAIQNNYTSELDEYAEIELTTTTCNKANNGAQNGATCTDTSDYAHDYVTLEKVDETPYDSTKVENQKSDPVTFNPYNKLSIERSSNYDHIGVGANNAGRTVSDSENTYNTTTLGN